MGDSIVVIQCAGGKQPTAGHLHDGQGRRVMFVGKPADAPPSEDCIYARPDDSTGLGTSWREELLQYNREPGNNPLRLLPAWELYTNWTYRYLYDKCGAANLYILSAGWGLLPADFLTPNYDVTFSSGATGLDSYKRRGRRDAYEDWCMLSNTAKPAVFFGGKDYVRLFCDLTNGAKGPRTVFYNSAEPPSAPGCRLLRFQTNTRTNWHYEAARAFVDGCTDRWS